MDATILNLVQRLQRALDAVDSDKDRDTLVWAHGFLTGTVSSLQTRVPGLISTATPIQRSREEVDQILRRIAKSEPPPSDPDSLNMLEDEIGGPEDQPVPATRKPGPKGRTGGAAVPLTNNDLPM